jgi:hypothetical protein
VELMVEHAEIALASWIAQAEAEGFAAGRPRSAVGCPIAEALSYALGARCVVERARRWGWLEVMVEKRGEKPRQVRLRAPRLFLFTALADACGVEAEDTLPVVTARQAVGLWAVAQLLACAPDVLRELRRTHRQRALCWSPVARELARLATAEGA